jgi:hypothetical protein
MRWSNLKTAVFKNHSVFGYLHTETAPSPKACVTIRATNEGLCKFYLEMLDVISTYNFPGLSGTVILTF